MILGLSLPAFTAFHVALSLIGIGAGLVVLVAMQRANAVPRWTSLFLWTTVLTSATGFLFPFEKILPSHIVGAISLVVLAFTLYAWYGRRLAGRWRAVYVITATIALWFNVFVLVAQAFAKIPSLHALAPNGNEPPFGIAEGVVLVVFIVAGWRALRRFHPAATTGVA